MSDETRSDALRELGLRNMALEIENEHLRTEIESLQREVDRLENEKFRKVWDTHNAGFDAGYELAESRAKPADERTRETSRIAVGKSAP